MAFSGAKLALFLGADLLVIRRDNRPDIPFPDHWDLPGGGREGGESPQACALRETYEEVGLCLRPRHLLWAATSWQPHGRVWFFVARRPAAQARAVRFGNEGQGWRLMAPAAYCRDRRAIPHMAAQLRRFGNAGGFPRR